MESLELELILPVTPRELFSAWMSSVEHRGFTGSPAQIDPKPGGDFTTLNGYLRGKTFEMNRPHRILQSWRTTDFPKEAPDSRLELSFEPHLGDTRLLLRQTNIPDSQKERCKRVWEEYYFAPMRLYFQERNRNSHSNH